MILHIFKSAFLLSIDTTNATAHKITHGGGTMQVEDHWVNTPYVYAG